MRKTLDLKRISIDFVAEWLQLFGKYNWEEFHFLMLRMEKENIHGMFEVEFFVLGFGVRFYWTWNTKMRDKKVLEYSKMIKEGNWVELDGERKGN